MGLSPGRGDRHDAELGLARLRVADHEKRLPTGGTNARTVDAAFQLNRRSVGAGPIEPATSSVLTVRSTSQIMAAFELHNGRRFGGIPNHVRDTGTVDPPGR